ncbi:MAG: aldo/keto reductase, partial [Oscillospiraceae bacterium]|nr:aldo/keto reductase [Oscillospiraceae bacterium]
YIYPGSEAALGQILERNKIRDKVYIATKLPHYMLKAPDGMDKFFSEQLKRLRTDYVDYYLIHMLTDVNTWERLKKLGIIEWLEKKKSFGAVRQIGFSYHGNSDTFCALLDAYDWDFCQIQYNYLDENSQAGVTGLKRAAEKGLPVIIMEPLRGGNLANKLPHEAIKLFEEYPVKRSPAEWAFRWLWNQPEVTCVLSGMNSIDMINENVSAASDVKIGEFTDNEFELISGVVGAINANMKVGCTGCRYCMPCPKNVDIPGTFAAYNRRYSDGKFRGFKDYIMCVAARKEATAASNCVECGKCEKQCPQGIEIRKELQNARRVFEGPVYKAARKVISSFIKY